MPVKTGFSLKRLKIDELKLNLDAVLGLKAYMNKQALYSTCRNNAISLFICIDRQSSVFISVS